jgi:hypothetical protein
MPLNVHEIVERNSYWNYTFDKDSSIAIDCNFWPDYYCWYCIHMLALSIETAPYSGLHSYFLARNRKHY